MFHPTVDPVVWARFPQYRALSIIARDYVPGSLIAPIDPTPLPEGEAHHEAWTACFRAFGADPKRHPPSMIALRKRFDKDGTLPQIHPIVDAYNALSLRYSAPFGGEDLDRYSTSPYLTLAQGGEPFDTQKDGAAFNDPALPGEVIWRDAVGATCRRWNWRQCRRTAITPDTRNVWFVIDRLPALSLEALHEAGHALASALTSACAGCSVEIKLLAP